MAERLFFTLLFKDKTITNPINKTEIITCSELFSDYKSCRKQYNKGLKRKAECRDIRMLAQNCYINSEEDFEKHLIKIFEDKMKYISYLKKEDSLLYNYYKEDSTVFSIKKFDVNSSGNQAFNEVMDATKLSKTI